MSALEAALKMEQEKYAHDQNSAEYSPVQLGYLDAMAKLGYYFKEAAPISPAQAQQMKAQGAGVQAGQRSFMKKQIGQAAATPTTGAGSFGKKPAGGATSATAGGIGPKPPLSSMRP